MQYLDLFRVGRYAGIWIAHTLKIGYDLEIIVIFTRFRNYVYCKLC